MSRRPGRSRPWDTMNDDQIVSWLICAYSMGAFPMADPATDEVDFYRPEVRGVLPLPSPMQADDLAAGFHVPATVERLLRRGRFEFRCDTALQDVIRACAEPRAESQDERDGLSEPGTWINETIVRWYTLLHQRGHAHSVEAWGTDPFSGESRLVGGIYGVAIGSAFFGESMFHRAAPRRVDGERDHFDGTSAGQACLVVLARHLAALGFTLFDVQMVTGIVRRFGGHEVPLEEYLARLQDALASADRWRPLPPRSPGA